MREPKTEPIPAPEPATPTVAAPAPMYLAAESISKVRELVWKDLTPILAARPLYPERRAGVAGAAALSTSSGRAATAEDAGAEVATAAWRVSIDLATGATRVRVLAIMMLVGP